MIHIDTIMPEPDNNTILYNDSFFNLYTISETWSEEDLRVMQTVDGATLIDDMHMQTRFGIGTLRDLSTGCKTLLNLRKHPEKRVFVSGCGPNVLSEIFCLQDIHIIMLFPVRFNMRENTQVCFNGRDVVTGRHGFEQWWSEEYKRRSEA